MSRKAVVVLAMEVKHTGVTDEALADLVGYLMSVLEEDEEMAQRVVCHGANARIFPEGEVPDFLRDLKEFMK